MDLKERLVKGLKSAGEKALGQTKDIDWGDSKLTISPLSLEEEGKARAALVAEREEKGDAFFYHYAYKREIFIRSIRAIDGDKVDIENTELTLEDKESGERAKLSFLEYLRHEIQESWNRQVLDYHYALYFELLLDSEVEFGTDLLDRGIIQRLMKKFTDIAKENMSPEAKKAMDEEAPKVMEEILKDVAVVGPEDMFKEGEELEKMMGVKGAKEEDKASKGTEEV